MHGAMYAMEQAGHLLHDALALYKSGRYASSTVLSVFAREEIGRSAILLEMRQNVFASGSVVSAEAVVKACDDHVAKLTRGRGGITFEWGPERSADLKGLWADPQSEDSKKAHAVVDDWVERKAGRDPNDTHRKRMRALYDRPEARAALRARLARDRALAQLVASVRPPSSSSSAASPMPRSAAESVAHEK